MAKKPDSVGVGVVGLGIMGGAFARNLVAAGWSVIGYDPDAKARRAAARAGVQLAKDIQALVQMAPVIITSLPDPAALHATIAVVAAAKVSQRVLVETSTFALDDKIAAEGVFRKAGHVMLDCPISGTGSQAVKKDIVVYASGDAAVLRKLKPLFAGFARDVHDLGDFGNGSKMKYVANLLVAINNVASAEAMVLGMKAGLDPKQIYDMVKSGAGNSRVFELRAPMMVSERYGDATMKVKVWQKDMAVIGEFAKSLGVPTPLFSATEPIYNAAMETGHAMEDTAVVCAVMEKMAGVKRKSGKKRS